MGGLMDPLIEGRDLRKTYRVGSAMGPRQEINAVSGVTLTLRAGEVVALVGESGSGKTTLGRLLVGLELANTGAVHLQGTPVASRAEWRDLRRHVQYVFQDAYAALPPTMRIRDIVAEPLRINRIGDPPSQRRKVDELLEQVGLSPAAGDRFPRQFSGGERRRINLARALALGPQVLICDEIVSGLDVSGSGSRHEPAP